MENTPTPERLSADLAESLAGQRDGVEALVECVLTEMGRTQEAESRAVKGLVRHARRAVQDRRRGETAAVDVLVAPLYSALASQTAENNVKLRVVSQLAAGPGMEPPRPEPIKRQPIGILPVMPPPIVPPQLGLPITIPGFPALGPPVGPAPIQPLPPFAPQPPAPGPPDDGFAPWPPPVALPGPAPVAGACCPVAVSIDQPDTFFFSGLAETWKATYDTWAGVPDMASFPSLEAADADREKNDGVSRGGGGKI